MSAAIDDNSMQSHPPTWTKRWLVAAGIYNIVWGAMVVLFPSLLFSIADMEQPLYPQIWQCVGMIVGVYGIGYLCAARNSRVHWPIVLVGLLGKIFGPIGFAGALVTGDLPPMFGLTILTNDLIWWVPFSMMLWDAARAHSASGLPALSDFKEAIDVAEDQEGRSLYELSHEKPVFVAFIRHAGCTFCKEMLADLGRQRQQLEERGMHIALVGMEDRALLQRLASNRGLDGISVVNDPERRLYSAFELGIGSFVQLFGIRVWIRGVLAAFRGHFVGVLRADGLQMPGVFVLENGKITKANRHRSAAERVDHARFACGVPV